MNLVETVKERRIAMKERGLWTKPWITLKIKGWGGTEDLEADNEPLR